MNNDVQNSELEFEDADFVEPAEGLPAPDRRLKTQEQSEQIEKNATKLQERAREKAAHQTLFIRNVLLPVIFLTVTLLGGLRVASADNALVFLRPELICLVFAAILLVLFVRARLIDLGGWFSESFSSVKNISSGVVLFSLFTASVQLSNSLLPEAGILFWIIGFCLFWLLWTNLFGGLSPEKLVRSLAAGFGLVFVVKYLVLANLTAPASENWLRGMLENPSKEAFTWLLDLPRFAPATGYIQFFTIVLYLAGLYLLPRQFAKARE
ncbi:MAG TPA: hypothetical protein VL325_05445 [Pyrinomonadaceae bacterium]|jgi:hypothetical protein|nr:hypothetical protein [Pyrinomonadaceae bacterium]